MHDHDNDLSELGNLTPSSSLIHLFFIMRFVIHVLSSYFLLQFVMANSFLNCKCGYYSRDFDVIILRDELLDINFFTGSKDLRDCQRRKDCGAGENCPKVASQRWK